MKKLFEVNKKLKIEASMLDKDKEKLSRTISMMDKEKIELVDNQAAKVKKLKLQASTLK